MSDIIDETRLMLAVAEACWREEEPSYSWHVFEWRAWRIRMKIPLVRNRDRIINTDWNGP